MNIFKDRTYKWWQIGVFKLALLSFGIAIGLYWNETLLPFFSLFVGVAIVFSAYIIFISLKQ